MFRILAWWCDLSPLCFHCCASQWRSHLLCVRACQLYGGKVLLSGAAPQDMWRRLTRRQCAEAITLWHDSGDAQLELWERCLDTLPVDHAARLPSLALLRAAVSDSWVAAGRNLSVLPDHCYR